MPQRRDRCTYCGSTKNLTRDHVPPKNLFAKRLPNNLITVPSCKDCNERASKDDEYFRLMLSIEENVCDHPDVESNLAAIVRSLESPRKVGFREAFRANSGFTDVFSATGLWIGRKPCYRVKLNRLKRVVERIIKGLFYHEKKTSLTEKWAVRVVSEAEMRQPREKDIEVIRSLFSIKPKVIGNDVFSYRVRFFSNDPNASAWFLLFYRRIWFWAVTMDTTRGMDYGPQSIADPGREDK